MATMTHTPEEIYNALKVIKDECDYHTTCNLNCIFFNVGAKACNIVNNFESPTEWIINKPPKDYTPFL